MAFPRLTPPGFQNVPARAALVLALLLGGTVAAQPAAEPLTLPEAVHRGVAQNLDLISQRLRLDRQRRLERGAWISYSPTVVLDANLVQLRAPTNPGGGRTVHLHSAGIVWRSPVGTVVSAEGVMTQGLPADGGPSQGGVVLGVSQPLLRDAWLTGAALPLREAELQTAVQREVFRQALNALIVEVETGYWDLAVAEADMVIKTRSLARARQQFEDTQENIRRGILAPTEVYVVEENVVFFELEVTQAEENLRRARRRLADLLQLQTDVAVVATQPMEKPELQVPVVGAILATGMDLNPRLIAQRHRHALAQLRERHAHNQALPGLDVSASLSLLGQDPRYPAAWGATLADPTPEARAGLRFSLPLDRGAQSALVDAAVLESERERLELAGAERQVTFEILNGVSDLQNQLELLALTEKQVELAELKLGAETEKYQGGLSTLADVVRFQRDLDNALIRLQRVTRGVRVGQVRLLAAQGDLHQRVGVELR
jgi:outer membrane protein